MKEWQSRIAYVPQDPFLLDDTIQKNITFGEGIILCPLSLK